MSFFCNISSDELIPDASENLPISLINLGSDDTFDVDASISPDDASVFVDISPTSVFLSSFEISSAVMTLTSRADATVGEAV